MAGKRAGPRVLTLPALRGAAPATFSAWDDPSRVAAFERSVRVLRARQESFTLTMLDDGPAFAVSGASGGEYVVDVPSFDEDPSCTCPDFFGNRLGTCKHVEAVRRAMVEHPDLVGT